MTGDFSTEEYLYLQRIVHRVSEAVRVEVEAEREEEMAALAVRIGRRMVEQNATP